MNGINKKIRKYIRIVATTVTVSLLIIFCAGCGNNHDDILIPVPDILWNGTDRTEDTVMDFYVDLTGSTRAYYNGEYRDILNSILNTHYSNTNYFQPAPDGHWVETTQESIEASIQDTANFNVAAGPLELLNNGESILDIDHLSVFTTDLDPNVTASKETYGKKVNDLLKTKEGKGIFMGTISCLMTGPFSFCSVTSSGIPQTYSISADGMSRDMLVIVMGDSDSVYEYQLSLTKELENYGLVWESTCYFANDKAAALTSEQSEELVFQKAGIQNSKNEGETADEINYCFHLQEMDSSKYAGDVSAKNVFAFAMRKNENEWTCNLYAKTEKTLKVLDYSVEALEIEDCDGGSGEPIYNWKEISKETISLDSVDGSKMLKSSDGLEGTIIDEFKDKYPDIVEPGTTVSLLRMSGNSAPDEAYAITICLGLVDDTIAGLNSVKSRSATMGEYIQAYNSYMSNDTEHAYEVFGKLLKYKDFAEAVGEGLYTRDEQTVVTIRVLITSEEYAAE